MRIAALAVLVASALPLHAQESPSEPAPQCVADPAQITDDNCYKPPMSAIVLAFTQANLHGIDTSVHLTYDEKGYVTSATLNRSTHSKRLDNAIVEWARMIKLMPGTAGENDMPVAISAP